MKLVDLNPVYQNYLDELAQWAKPPSLWRNKARRTLAAARGDVANEDDLLKLVHDVQRLRKVFLGGLENNQAFFDEVKKHNPPTWKRFTAPPADDDLQKSLADRLYNADPAKGDVPILYISQKSRKIAPRLLERAMADGVHIVPLINDKLFNAAVLKHTDKPGVSKLADDFLRVTTPVTTRISARINTPPVPVSAGKNGKLYSDLTRAFNDRGAGGQMHFTLTVLPTAEDAKLDRMNYRDYTKLFFEMCDQPWHEIDRAHRVLIKMLDDGKDIRFTNKDGTDIRMNIDGFTFCNSLVARNVPGSEVFSAPHIDSVEGTIVAKGLFVPKDDGRVIENLTMEFKKGWLSDWQADKGADIFAKVIAMDDGARRIGELGIGTNPHLKRHSCNGLLVEKISGSFHLALGGAYQMTNYLGTPVNVDNGNRSKLHWDVTTMLFGKEGRIILDGQTIMNDGQFSDPRLDVLNRGWEAVPRGQRPDYWKHYDFAAHKQQQLQLRR